MTSPHRKKILFKDFARENESKFAGKYPFLTAQQINAKLKQCWKKACKDERESQTIKSPVKNKSPAHNSKQHSRKNPSPIKAVQSPSISEVKLSSPPSPLEDLAGNKHENSELNETRSNDDSGGWYYESEGTLENTCESSSPQTNGLTDEIVKDVMSHTLSLETKETIQDIENNKEKQDSPEKGEKILSRLFHPMKERQNIENSPKESRLLASEEKEGESNFCKMFHENDDIFL